MQRLRKLLHPTLPKAMAVSAVAAVYAWMELFPAARSLPQARTVTAPPRAAVQAATPADLFVQESGVKTPSKQKETLSKPTTSVKKKRLHKKRAKTKVIKKTPVVTRFVRRPRRLRPKQELAQLIERELEQDLQPIREAALNYTGPLDTMLEEALAETPQTPLFHPNLMVASAEMDAEFWLDKEIPKYIPMHIAHMATVVRQNFEENHDVVDAAKAQAAEIAALQAPLERKLPEIKETLEVAASEPELPKALPHQSQELSVAKTEPVVPVRALDTQPKENTNQLIEAEYVKAEEEVLAATADVPPTREATKLEPEPVVVANAEAEREVVEEEIVPELSDVENVIEDTDKNVLVAGTELDTQPMTNQLVAPPAVPVASQKAAPDHAPSVSQQVPVRSEPKLAAVAPKLQHPEVELPTPEVVAKSRAALSAKTKSGVIAGELQGRFRVGQKVQRWLQSRGHAELFMHPPESRDPQDTLHLGTVRPGEFFKVDRRGLVGEYQLFAKFFSKNSGALRAQIAYPTTISAETYKAALDFFVSDREFGSSLSKRRGVASRPSVVTIPVFETAGGSEEDPLRGDFRTPRPIPSARVTVQGFEEWGVFEADASGNVRIPNVPSRSELLLRAEAKGYFPSMKLVTVADNGAHAPIYMLSASKLPAIRYYTQAQQQESKGFVLGRSFDPVSRTPLAGDSVSLSFRKSGAVYFSEYDPADAQSLGLFNAWTAMFLGAIPDLALKATTDLGLFAFLNVTPSFRAILREGRRAHFSYVHPGHLNYFEFGRGGAKNLRGRVIDPFGGKVPEARIRVVGDKSYEVFTDTSNRFQIENVDYSGQITLEIEAPGYPTIWHDVAFNTADADRQFDFFILDEDLVEETARRAKVKRVDSQGSLIGGAESSFFSSNSGCVRVALEDSRGRKVTTERGPFPFGADGEIKDDALCLTKAHPGFAYYNLPVGQYRQKFFAEDGKLLRTHIRNIGSKSVSISVN